MNITTTTISPKFQIVIPKKIRENLSLTYGQKLQVITHRGQITLIPIKKASEFRGILSGVKTKLIREKNDRKF